MDAHAVLGLPHGATKEQVKARYRELVRRWHPDKNKDPGAPAKMQEINRAYEMLINGPFMRSASTNGQTPYEQYVNRKKQQASGDPFGFASQQQWDDLIKKNFHDAFKRAQEEFNQYRYTPPPPKKCPHCNGTGWIPA